MYGVYALIDLMRFMSVVDRASNSFYVHVKVTCDVLYACMDEIIREEREMKLPVYFLKSNVESINLDIKKAVEAELDSLTSFSKGKFYYELAKPIRYTEVRFSDKNKNQFV